LPRVRQRVLVRNDYQIFSLIFCQLSSCNADPSADKRETPCPVKVHFFRKEITQIQGSGLERNTAKR
jgi:hypothetical protein